MTHIEEIHPTRTETSASPVQTEDRSGKNSEIGTKCDSELRMIQGRLQSAMDSRDVHATRYWTSRKIEHTHADWPETAEVKNEGFRQRSRIVPTSGGTCRLRFATDS